MSCSKRIGTIILSLTLFASFLVANNATEDLSIDLNPNNGFVDENKSSDQVITTEELDSKNDFVPFKQGAEINTNAMSVLNAKNASDVLVGNNREEYIPNNVNVLGGVLGAEGGILKAKSDQHLPAKSADGHIPNTRALSGGILGAEGGILKAKEGERLGAKSTEGYIANTGTFNPKEMSADNAFGVEGGCISYIALSTFST